MCSNKNIQTFFKLKSSGVKLGTVSAEGKFSAMYARNARSVEFCVDQLKWSKQLWSKASSASSWRQPSQHYVATSTSEPLFVDCHNAWLRDGVARTLLVSSTVKCAARRSSSYLWRHYCCRRCCGDQRRPGVDWVDVDESAATCAADVVSAAPPTSSPLCSHACKFLT